MNKKPSRFDDLLVLVGITAIVLILLTDGSWIADAILGVALLGVLVIVLSLGFLLMEFLIKSFRNRRDR